MIRKYYGIIKIKITAKCFKYILTLTNDYNMNFKEIHIGKLIRSRVSELGLEMSRICNFLDCTEKEIERVFKQKSLDSDILLRWSKLLEYDFFRIYTQHLILYAPPASTKYNNPEGLKSDLPHFRKNIYTKEVIDFILELIFSEEKTRAQVIEEYRIPKTTLYKWMKKYKNEKDSGLQ